MPIVAAIMTDGVSSIDSFERSQLSVEKDEPKPKPEPVQEKKAKAKTSPRTGGKQAKPAKEITKVVERRQVTMTITTDQRPLQALMNILASPTKSPILRWLETFVSRMRSRTAPSGTFRCLSAAY